MGTLEVLVIILIIAWLGGFFFHIAGKLIHILLILAVIAIIARLLGLSF
ncbi:MAG: lmo0937 family membrane protein [Candidatus Levyibacteriota bacterium]